MGKAERRNELLGAARAVFATKGFHDAKIEDIAAAARVAKGTFYLYFVDKRSIFAELVDGLAGRIESVITPVDPRGDVPRQVRSNLRAIVDVLLDEPALTQLLLSYAPGLDPAFVEKVRTFQHRMHELLRSSLAEGQRLGLVADGDCGLLATFTIGALKELLFERAALGRARPREACVEALYALLEAGYLRMPRSTSRRTSDAGGVLTATRTRRRR